MDSHNGTQVALHTPDERIATLEIMLEDISATLDEIKTHCVTTLDEIKTHCVANTADIAAARTTIEKVSAEVMPTLEGLMKSPMLKMLLPKGK